MHVAIIADPVENQSAGIYRYTEGMIRAIADYLPDVKVTVIMRRKSFAHSRVTSVLVPGLLPLKNDPYRKLIAIPRLINRIQPDVVIEPAHFGPVRINKGIKRITVIHDLVPVLHPEYSDTFSSLMQRLFLPRILRKTQLIIANSLSTQHSIEKKYPHCTGKIHMVYPGISIPETAAEWDPQNISGVAPGRYFLHVGTIEPRKNIYRLLTAFETFKKKTGDTSLKLVLAGNTGWKSRNFATVLKRHPNHDSVILTGHVSDTTLAMLYRHATALVFPSLYEGFGFPCAEAMQHHCPLLLSDIEVFREVSGGNAQFFNPESEEEMANTMIHAYYKQTPPLVTGNAVYGTGKYTWENFARSLSDILRL
jgi:glycosyltransferase involved in cell wall biosynthesis